MKLQDIKGERALTVLADLIDPIRELSGDAKFRKMLNGDKLEAVKYLLKNHTKTIITVLAILDGKNPNTYEPNLLTLPVMLLDFFNDPTVIELFGLQSQTDQSASSGSVTENTEAKKA